MTRKVSGMQCGLILFISAISLKFLVFPSLFSKYAFRDVYFSILMGIILDFIFSLIVIKIIIKHPHLTFKQLLTKTMGKTVATIIMFLLFSYFFIKGVVIIKETHNYFNETLFEHINWFMFIIPLFVLIAYLMIKDFRAIGRSLQFFCVLIFFALLFTILMPISEIDFSNLLPIFENGVGGVFKAFFYSAFAFGDYFVLFLLMGKVDVKPNTSKTIISYLIVADIIVFAFYVVFACIFGNLGLNHSQAISELLMYTSTRTSTGTLNWFNIMIWLLILFFEIGLVLSCSSQLVTEMFNFKTRYYSMMIIIVLLIGAVLYLYLSLIKAINIITSFPFVVYVIALQVLLPIICWLLSKTIKSKSYINTIKDIVKANVKYQLTNILGTVTHKKFYTQKQTNLLTHKNKKQNCNNKKGKVQNA